MAPANSASRPTPFSSRMLRKEHSPARQQRTTIATDGSTFISASIATTRALDSIANIELVASSSTAACIAVFMHDVFKIGSAPDVRALYQKHAIGNSLLRNDGSTFKDITISSGTGVGCWAWSIDSFDFDDDGFP